jgi:hypothetical protein
VSLEQVAVETVWPFGKVLALGEPLRLTGGKRPEAALRILVRNEWQEAVRTWIHEARYVLMTVGSTGGLMWEFQQLLESGDWQKITLVLRHDKPAVMAHAWRQLCFGHASLLSPDDEVIGRSLAVRFSNEGSVPVFLSAKRRTVASYKVALGACWLPLEQFSELIGATNCGHSSAR